MFADILNLSTSFLDYPSIEDQCVTVYFTGCDFRCQDCYNSHLQTMNSLNLTSIDELVDKIIDLCNRARTKKVVLLGGDPLASMNIDFTKKLLSILKELKFSVCVYTGNTIDFVKYQQINEFTYIKCGQYDNTQRQLPYKTEEEFCLASKNQEIYDNEYNLLSNNGIMKF